MPDETNNLYVHQRENEQDQRLGLLSKNQHHVQNIQQHVDGNSSGNSSNTSDSEEDNRSYGSRSSNGSDSGMEESSAPSSLEAPMSEDSGVDVTDAPRTTSLDISVQTYIILHYIKSAFNSNILDLKLPFAIHRYFTYPVDWVVDISREQLANSGFFLTEDFENVQCYFCKLQITERYDWENIESIDAKHRELNPDCPLMKGEDTNNIPINDPTNYRYEAHRLYSLLTTSWHYPVTPYDLAKNGFYWTGSTDNCRCAFCRLEVRGWEEGDTAAGEHLRWNPNCVFINDRAVGNVPIGREISEEALVNDEAGIYPSNQSSFSINPFARCELSAYRQIRYSNKSGPRPPVETLGVTPLNPPKHSEYATVQSRVNSYRMWPMSLPQRPNILAEAGFYYTGSGDRVICFQCGGGLKDWAATDTPWCEHAKWFSRCPYLLLKKGKSFVDQTLKDQQIEMPVLAFQEALANSMNMTLTPNKAEEVKVEETVATTEKLKINETTTNQESSSSSLLCKLCQKKDIQTVYLPCGHMVSCMDCIDKETTCRTCKKPRVAYVRTFLQ